MCLDVHFRNVRRELLVLPRFLSLTISYLSCLEAALFLSSHVLCSCWGSHSHKQVPAVTPGNPKVELWISKNYSCVIDCWNLQSLANCGITKIHAKLTRHQASIQDFVFSGNVLVGKSCGSALYVIVWEAQYQCFCPSASGRVGIGRHQCHK